MNQIANDQTNRMRTLFRSLLRSLFRRSGSGVGESGLASLLVVILSVTVFLSAGLAVDASRVLGSTRECDLVAAGAARVASQWFVNSQTAAGDLVLDVVAAKDAAEKTLREQGYSTFAVEVTDTTVRVKVWQDISMVMLVGWAHTRVNGSATAQLRTGIEQ
jgi:hypothetical protein